MSPDRESNISDVTAGVSVPEEVSDPEMKFLEDLSVPMMRSREILLGQTQKY